MASRDEEKERDPDGRFAPENKQTEKISHARNFGVDKKGKVKRGPGRPKGSKNRSTLEWKQFALMMSNDPDVQEALKARILDRPELLLRLAEHAFGRPKETQDVEHSGEIGFRWLSEKS